MCPDGVEVQAEADGELGGLEWPFGLKRLQQAHPTRATQDAVGSLVERRRGWRNQPGSRGHGLDFTPHIMVKTIQTVFILPSKRQRRWTPPRPPRVPLLQHRAALSSSSPTTISPSGPI